jgi:protocadherin Fat 1/2/3
VNILGARPVKKVKFVGRRRKIGIFTFRKIAKSSNLTFSSPLFKGNVGNAFSIDSDTGAIQVARELDLSTNKEYMLTIKASDGGSPSLSSVLRVHVMVTMADNAPPK